MGEDETGVTDGRPSGLNERSAERMEWKRTTEAKRCLYGDDARGLFSGWFWW